MITLFVLRYLAPWYILDGYPWQRICYVVGFWIVDRVIHIWIRSRHVIPANFNFIEKPKPFKNVSLHLLKTHNSIYVCDRATHETKIKEHNSPFVRQPISNYLPWKRVSFHWNYSEIAWNFRVDFQSSTSMQNNERETLSSLQRKQFVETARNENE